MLQKLINFTHLLRIGIIIISLCSTEAIQIKKLCQQMAHVAVTGRNQTMSLFLSIFDRFFDVHVCLIKAATAYSNSYICAASTPTLGLYVQSTALGKLIELS